MTKWKTPDKTKQCIKLDIFGSPLPLNWCNASIDSCLTCEGCESQQAMINEPTTGKDNQIVGYYVCPGYTRKAD